MTVQHARRDGNVHVKGAFKTICGKVRHCNRENLEPVIELAVEIAREGREGRRIGTLFTFGDANAVMERSRPLILDPLAGHSDESKTSEIKIYAARSKNSRNSTALLSFRTKALLSRLAVTSMQSRRM
jgi:DNA integrity scanning protein DisA with diadenylate cyclase activity